MIEIENSCESQCDANATMNVNSSVFKKFNPILGVYFSSLFFSGVCCWEIGSIQFGSDLLFFELFFSFSFLHFGVHLNCVHSRALRSFSGSALDQTSYFFGLLTCFRFESMRSFCSLRYRCSVLLTTNDRSKINGELCHENFHTFRWCVVNDFIQFQEQ